MPSMGKPNIHQVDELEQENAKLKLELEELKTQYALLEENCKKSTEYQIEQEHTHQLFRNNELYRSIIETAHEGIWVNDADYHTIFANQRLADMLGYTREELVGKSPFDFMDGEAIPQAKIFIKRRTQGFKDLYEQKYIRKDGSELWVTIAASPIYDKAGKFMAYLGMLTDITQRKQMEETLRANEAVMEAFFDASPGILNLFDQQLRYIKSDRLTPTYFGLDRKNLLGKSVADLNPQFAEQFLYPIMKKVTETKEPVLNMIVGGPVPSKQGAMGYWSMSYFPVPLPGNNTGLGCMGLDVTEVKQTEQVLAYERELFEGIFNNIPVMITVYDPELKNFRFNNELKQVLGWTEDDVSDGNFISKVYPDPDYRKVVIEFMQSLQPGWKELNVTAKNGSIVTSSWANILLTSGVQIGIGIDMRERKKSEDALRESEEKLQAMFNNAGIGIVEFDFYDRFIAVNDRLCKILDYSPEELLGKTVSEITAPEDRLVTEDMNTRLHRGEFDMFDYEKRYLKKDGTPLWVHVTVSAVHDLLGRHMNSIGTVEDISDRKESEEALLRSETILKQAGTMANLGAWEIEITNYKNINENDLLWSDQIYRIFGYEPGSVNVTNNLFFSHVHPDDRQKVSEAFAKAIKERSFYSVEHRIIRTDGTERTVMEHAEMSFDNFGKPVQIIGAVQDITERKKIMDDLKKNEEWLRTVIEAVKESEEKFRLLFENITEGVALHEMIYENDIPVNYRIINVNPSYTRYTGFNINANTTMLATEYYKTNKVPYLKEYAEVANTGIPYKFQTFFPEVNKHFIINVISPRKGQFATVLEDITDQKLIEHELKQKNEELTRFIYTVSHDLKSPLVTIKSFTSYLKEDIEIGDTAAQDKDIAYIQNAADKMGKLLDELLELSRIGRKEEAKTEVPLKTIAEAALDLVAGRITGKKVKVQFTGPQVILYGHTQRLVQLYQNLLDNAVKFMGPQPEPLIEIGSFTDEQKSEVVLFVKDNGSGIDPQYHHKVFGLFEKLDTGTEGTGIGLALIKRIVEVHGGTIWFTSEGEGKGTTFYFTLEKTHILT